MGRVWNNWWLVTLVTAALVAIVLAVVFPIFVLALRPWWIRLLIVLFVAAVWGGFAAYRLWRARKASDAIAGELSSASAADNEANALAGRMAEALAGLKKASGGRRDYLYSRPWYVIIGPPGAGKTTALLNSGLRFPFSETALKGVGGTRNLDFWFADEAVLVDTAGRYTTQDSDAAIDSAGWRSFLKLLKRFRPLQPINGVIVAIAVDELLRADRASLDAHAAAVRRRITELQQELEVAPPVYVVVTKADLLAGFVEFFEDLDVEGRRAVFGATTPEAAPTTPSSIVAEFDLVLQKMADRVSKRLQEEPDNRRRALILGFPTQLEGLRARMTRFLDGAFFAEDRPLAKLRGFYLSSGVQQGAPLDRVLAELASVYERAPAPGSDRGRAYFLNKLLTEVIFPEAGLVQTDPAARRRRGLALTAGLAAVVGVSAIILLLWAVSFARNRTLQDHLLAAAQSVHQQIQQADIDLAEVGDADPDLDATLPVLGSLRNLPAGYAERRQHPVPLFMTFGLYQHGLSDAAQLAYLEALRRIMLPREILRTERVLKDNQKDALALYEPFKVYLMLGGQHALDKDAVRAWVESDWSTALYPGDDRQQDRANLSQHLDALLADGRLSNAGLDGDLIAASRITIETLAPADRAYAIMKARADAPAKDWRMSDVLTAADAKAFANGDAVLGLTVPYFYTKDGYRDAYLPSLASIEDVLKKDVWIYGNDSETVQSGQLANVRPGVAGYYARDYDLAWDKVIKTPAPANYFTDPTATAAFTNAPSPLKRILIAAQANSTFSSPADHSLQNRLSIPSLIGSVRAAEGGNSTAGVDAGQIIHDHFAPVVQFLTSGALDTFVSGVQDAAKADQTAQFQGGSALGSGMSTQTASAAVTLRQNAAGAPDLLQPFMQSAAKGGVTAAAGADTSAIESAYTQNLLPTCRSVTDQKYPFFGRSDSDAAVADMQRLFAQNGQFDSFVRQNAAALMDESGPEWRWNSANPAAAGLQPTSAEELHWAQKIDDLLTSGLQFKVESAGFGGQVTAVELASGGNTARFETGQVGAHPFNWNLTGLQDAHVTLFNGQTVVKTYQQQGPWALFRLMDQANKSNAGPTAIKATFGEGAAFATLLVTLPTNSNPFSRGGVWSFRCPASL